MIISNESEKQCFLFGSKTVILGQEVQYLLHGIHCILYRIKFANLQLHAKKTKLSRK